MKKALLSILFTALTMSVGAQSADSTYVTNDSTTENSHVYDVIDQLPQFPGGQKALLEFLGKNVKYPELAAKYGVEGRVIMAFIVEKDGSISGIKAANCKIQHFNTTKFSQETENRQKELKEQFALLFAKEGARVLRMTPKWIPGRNKGELVRAKYVVPITFRMR